MVVVYVGIFRSCATREAGRESGRESAAIICKKKALMRARAKAVPKRVGESVREQRRMLRCRFTLRPYQCTEYHIDSCTHTQLDMKSRLVSFFFFAMTLHLTLFCCCFFTIELFIKFCVLCKRCTLCRRCICHTHTRTPKHSVVFNTCFYFTLIYIEIAFVSVFFLFICTVFCSRLLRFCR